MDRIINIKVGGNHLSKDSKNAGVRGEANVTKLRITFDEGWDGYAKTVTFWDAQGKNPVKRIQGVDLIEDITTDKRTYITPIPKEPLAIAGELTFVIDGYLDGKRQRSISDKLVVKDSPDTDNAGEPTDPTPTQAEQLQKQIETIMNDVQGAAKAAASASLAETAREEAEKHAERAETAAKTITDMTVSVQGLDAGEAPTVEKGTKGEVVHLSFGIPKGDKGDKGDMPQKGVDYFTQADLDALYLPTSVPVVDEEGVLVMSELPADTIRNAAEAAERSRTEAAYSAAEAQSHADKAYNSSVDAAESEETASQALADLLAMINSGDLVLATDGKLPLSAIPATATQEIYTVTSEDELTSLTAQRGDLAELIEEIEGERTITKTWQCLGDASIRENWVVWGTSYAVQAGSATTANNATNANMINNHRIVEMTEEEFQAAVKDENTYYLVY